MTPYKQSLDAFKESKEWEAASDPTTIYAPERMRTYLENRLLRAFEAGYTAGQQGNGEAK